MKKAAVFHSSAGTLTPIQKLAQKIMPDVEIMHIIEESMIRDVMKNGGPSPVINARIGHYIQCARMAGCRIFMTACSSIGSSVERHQFGSEIPLMRIDEAMVDEAVERGRKIAVLATVKTTLKPTMELISRRAAAQSSKNLEISSNLMSDAYTAFLAGDLPAHDAIVSAGLRQASREGCDVVVLAQASMARVLEGMEKLPVPVLTSPERGIRLLKKRIDQLP